MNNLKLDSGKDVPVKTAQSSKSGPSNSSTSSDASFTVAALHNQTALTALKRKRRGATEEASPVDEREQPTQSNTESSVMSDMVVAQAESGLSGGAGLGSSAGAAGASGATSAGLSAAGSASGAAGSASISGSVAATTSSVAATTTVTAASSATGISNLAGVAGGAAALGAGGGGGGGNNVIAPPAPPPPSNPFSNDPNPSSPPYNPPGSTVSDEHRSSVDGTNYPSLILHKSLVIDLGATSGPLNGTLYHTQLVDGVEVTHVVSYSGIQDVEGTGKNDQITGNARANVLDGGAGNDVIYGAGGADTLIGGEGNDWVLFKPLTRSYGSSPYNDGVYISLVDGVYKSASQTANVEKEASGFENVVGSNGNDIIIGDEGDNIIDGGGGDDRIYALGGYDRIFVGAKSVTGSQIWGDGGVVEYNVGYAINPVVRALLNQNVDPTDNTGVTSNIGTAVIHDWSAEQDSLNISRGSLVVIAGLQTQGEEGWDWNDVVDLSLYVNNLGTINIAAGAAWNDIYGSTGSDHYWVGYQYVGDGDGVVNAALAPSASGSAEDYIWLWDDQSASRDALDVAEGSTAVIAGLAGKEGWSGNDTVDLRSQVNNAGTIVVSAGAGSNLLYGSSGDDEFYGSSGSGYFDQIWGGAGNNAYYIGWSYDAIPSNSTQADSVSTALLWDWSQEQTLQVSSTGVAVLAQLRGQSNWNGDDYLNLSNENVFNDGVIVVALGNGTDYFSGSNGADHVYGGTSNGEGNQLWGWTGADVFNVGYNFDPLKGALNEVAGRSDVPVGSLGLDVIHDWENEGDTLVVGARGRAVIGGLGGSDWNNEDWSGDDWVDLRSSTNLGTIVVAAGGGLNQIEGSSGTDQYWVGYEYPHEYESWTIDGSVNPTYSAAAYDDLWSWDDQSQRRDQLHVAYGSTAIIGGLQGKDNWDGNDTVDLRAQVWNDGWIQVAAGRGVNTLYASTGCDAFYVGYVNVGEYDAIQTSGPAVDSLYGWDAQAWDGSSTFYRDTNWNGDTFYDDGNYDSLDVDTGSKAIIQSLQGMDAANAARWNGDDTVDLRSNVLNGGEIVVWTGNGNDHVYGSTGRELIYGGAGIDEIFGGYGQDVFYVGYAPSFATTGASNAETHIWDWQNGTDANYTGDGMRVAAGSFSVIAGLWGMNPQSGTRWNGDDTVDLRWDVINAGKIIVETGAGNDSIYGSTGNDWIIGGSGLNQYYLGNGGADRVYIDNYVGQQRISGFTADDKLYLDTRILDTFQVNKHISANYGVDGKMQTYTAQGNAWVDGQNFDDGTFFLSEITMNSANSRALGRYGAYGDFHGGGTMNEYYGWQSNGAWNNDAHEFAYKLARAALIAESSGFLATGYGLLCIPFVGPLLAITPLYFGGRELNDVINNIHMHVNATYNLTVDGGLTDGANILTSNNLLSGVNTGGNVNNPIWQGYNFLDFFSTTHDKFVGSLEVLGHQPYGDPALRGIASYVAVYSANETFVYMVFSQDGIIQNNETRLLAEVNGHLTADQLVMFNGATDADYNRYFGKAVLPPVFPGNPTVLEDGYATSSEFSQVLYSVSYTQGGSDVSAYVGLTALQALHANGAVSNLAVQQVLTNDVAPTITIHLDAPLASTDTVEIFVNGDSIPSETWTGQTGTNLNYNFGELGDGTVAYKVVVTTAEGFQAQYDGRLTVDTQAPDLASIGVNDTESTLSISSNEHGYVALYNGGTLFDSVDLTSANSDQGQFNLQAQGAVTTLSIEVSDIFGQTTYLDDQVILGTTGADTINESGSGGRNYIYGFGGNDTITASAHGDSIYGGAGNDTINAGIGDDKITGGAGADTINLPSWGSSEAVHTLLYSVSEAGTVSSDSNASFMDTVSGFVPGRDVISVVGTGISSFDATTGASVSVVGGNSVGSLNLDGTSGYTGTGDLQIAFVGTTHPTLNEFKASLQYSLTGTAGNDTMTGGDLGDNLTGGAGNDTLSGGAGNDFLTGGTGADTLTGGSGNDTFAFALGDSTTAAYDTITDLALSDGTNADTLSGLSAQIAANVLGFDGTDSGAIKSHAIADGLITFSGTDTYGSALSLTSGDLSSVVTYLQTNLGGVDHNTMAFKLGADSFVFQHNDTGGDLLVKLAGINNLAGLTFDPTGHNNYLVIA